MAAAVTVVAWASLALVLPLVLTLNPGELPTGAVVAASTDQIVIAEAVAMDIAGYELTLDRGTVALASAASGEAGRRLDSQRLAAGQAILSGDGLRLTTAAAPASQARGDDSGAPSLIAALSGGEFESLRLRRSTLVIPYDHGQLERLTNVSGDLIRKRKGVYTFKGTADIRGVTHAIDGSIGNGDKRSAGGQPVKLSVSGALLKGTFDGKIGGSDPGVVTGVLDLGIATGASFGSTLRALAQPPVAAAGPADEVRVRGEATWSGQSLAFTSVTVAYRGQEAQGALHLSLAGARPKLSGTLAAASLDLARLLMAEPAKRDPLDQVGTAAAQVASWWVFGSARPVWSAVDADVRVSAARTSGLPLPTGAAAASLYLSDGKLNAQVSELKVGNGRATGQITVDFQPLQPRVTIRAKADQLETAPLLTMLVGVPLVQGAVGVTADIKADGLDVEQILRSAEGNVAFAQKEGGRLGIDVRGLSLLAPRNVLVGWPAISGATNIEQLEGKIILRAGSASIENFSVRLIDGSISAAGGFGLAGGRLFVDLSMSAVKPLTQISVPGTAPFAEELIEIRGTIATPEVRRRSSQAREPIGPALDRGPG